MAKNSNQPPLESDSTTVLMLYTANLGGSFEDARSATQIGFPLTNKLAMLKICVCVSLFILFDDQNKKDFHY